MTNIPDALNISFMVFKFKWLLVLAAGFIALPPIALAERKVDLEKELDDARLIATVKIVSYKQGELRFQLVGKPSHPLAARFISDDPVDAMEYLDQKEISSMTSTLPMTGAWPAVGSQVLIVVNEKFYVSLFGARKGEVYRFWSPLPADDIPIFKCTDPARPLPFERHDKTDGLGDEGCLYPVKALKEKH